MTQKLNFYRNNFLQHLESDSRTQNKFINNQLQLSFDSLRYSLVFHVDAQLLSSVVLRWNRSIKRIFFSLFIQQQAQLPHELCEIENISNNHLTSSCITSNDAVEFLFFIFLLLFDCNFQFFICSIQKNLICENKFCFKIHINCC